MQFVNDDMDQLFRDAAKDYPLKTGSGDWNAVLNKMQDENNSAGKKTQRKKLSSATFNTVVDHLHDIHKE